jgi:uncharacterized membrane protein
VHRSRTALGLLLAFVALAATTIAGIVATWPQHRQIASFRQPKTFDAEVVALRAVRCQAPKADRCSRVTVQLREGPDRGRRAVFRFGDAGGTTSIGLGDRVLVYRNPAPAGAHVERYQFADFQRHRPLLWLAVAFAFVVVAAGRFRGVRALVGLTLSVATVVFYVVPAIAGGENPVAVAAFGGLGVMLLTIPLVHGGGAKSLAACLGTAAALVLTLSLADVFTRLAHLSGLTSEEAVYLQATSHVSVRGLLLAGMVIGALGVLGDTTVTQASTVMALRRANPGLGFADLVRHATSVGRDHIAATVNTLVLAYTGAALPILIVFSVGGTSFGDAVNSDTVAEALVATFVGSIGLIAAVPATTALAALLALRLPERRLRHATAHAHAH